MTTQPKTIYDLSPMARAYLECAAWSSSDESTEAGGEPFDSLDDWREQLAPETIAEAEKTCSAFEGANREDLIPWDSEQWGHDLWLTRNRHGVGFWARKLGTEESRERLTAAAEALGEVNMYFGDDGLIYIG